MSSKLASHWHIKICHVSFDPFSCSRVFDGSSENFMLAVGWWDKLLPCSFSFVSFSCSPMFDGFKICALAAGWWAESLDDVVDNVMFWTWDSFSLSCPWFRTDNRIMQLMKLANVQNLHLFLIVELIFMAMMLSLWSWKPFTACLVQNGLWVSYKQ